MRQAPERDYLSIKALFRDLVKACGGTKRASELTRGHASHISEAMASHVMERFPAIDQVYDLEIECGQPVLTRFMAEMHGLKLVPVDALAETSVAQVFARVVKECADVSVKMAEALADGTISDAERSNIIREAQQAIDELQALIAALKPRLREVKGL